MQDKYIPFINIKTEDGQKIFAKISSEYESVTGIKVSLSEYSHELYFKMRKTIEKHDEKKSWYSSVA